MSDTEKRTVTLDEEIAAKETSVEVEKLKAFTEMEVKFRVAGDVIYAFKQLVEKQQGLKGFVYIESDDIYYTKGSEFIRHRFAKRGDDKRQELTYKSKSTVNNNIIRKEVNLRVDPNEHDTVNAFVETFGFQRNFRISKIVHIYNFEDVTIPFYTVIDEQGKLDHFIEIELVEEKIPSLTEEEAWGIIKSWEAVLAPLGVNSQKRLRKSLFEMYRK